MCSGSWIVASLFSNSSSQNISTLFKHMSSFSEMYINNFGLVSYLRELLYIKTKVSNWLVILFDESINKIAQQWLMDFVLEFETNHSSFLDILLPVIFFIDLSIVKLICSSISDTTPSLLTFEPHIISILLRF